MPLIKVFGLLIIISAVATLYRCFELPRQAQRQVPGSLQAVGQRTSTKQKARLFGNCTTARSPIDEELFCEVKRQLAVHLAPPVQFARTCAYVGSSGLLRLHKNGRDIDDHDLVFRINHAPVVADLYEHIGSKDNVRVGLSLDHPYKVDLLKAKIREMKEHEELLVILWNEGWLSLGSLSSPQIHSTAIANYSIVDKRFVKLLTDLTPFIIPEDVGQPYGRAFTPSGGSVGMLAALSVCGRVDVYGMHRPNMRYIAEYYWEPPARWWYCILLDFVGSLGPYFLVRNRCSDGDNHNHHALRPAEHYLWMQISANTTHEVYSNGKLEIPGFRCVDCSSVGRPQPPARTLGIQGVGMTGGHWDRYVVLPDDTFQSASRVVFVVLMCLSAALLRDCRRTLSRRLLLGRPLPSWSL